MPPKPSSTRRFSLVSRIYVAGVVLVALSAVVAWGTAHFVWHETMPQHDVGRFAQYVAETVARDPDPRAAVARTSEALDVHLALYDRDGALVASDGPPLSDAPVLARATTLRDGDHGRYRVVTTTDGRRLVIAFHRRPHSRLPWGAGVLAALLVIGVAATLASRWLTRPLRQLGATAQSIAAGDLTKRTGIAANHEIGDAALAFDRMADRVEHLLRSQRELLASVSHELRTPLTRIRVALDLASEAAEPSAVRAELAGLEQDLGELELLVSDLLATARLDDRTPKVDLPLRRESTSLAEVAERARARFGERHPQRVVALTLGERQQAELDPRLLRRAIENVLDNAHKYSDPESAIQMDVRVEGARAVVEIRDHGLGIAAEDQAHVFAPFFRADRPEVRASSGLGLGLALARRIVEAHDGSIALESELGQGTTVRITI